MQVTLKQQFSTRTSPVHVQCCFCRCFAGDESDVASIFTATALQELLALCPTEACEACVWAIAQALPDTASAKSLLTSRLTAVAEGSLLPASLAPGDGREQHANTAAVLACLAGGPFRGKLAALLCSALDLDWPDSTAEAVPAASAASSTQARGRRAAAATSASSQDAADADLSCMACRRSDGDDSLLLCDGCDTALHRHCLRPVLDTVPAGDWLCPACCGEVRSCQLQQETALQYVQLLLLSDSGRALLLRCGGLQAAVTLLRQQALAAEARTSAVLAGTDASSSQQEQLTGVVQALQASVVYGRHAAHLLAEAAEQGAASLASGKKVHMQLTCC